MDYRELTEKINSAQAEENRIFTEWQTKLCDFRVSSPEGREMEVARLYYETMKERFNATLREFISINKPSVLAEIHRVKNEWKDRLREFQTEVHHVCHRYRDLILREDQDGVKERGDAIVGSSVWTWADYILTAVDDDGFCLLDNDGPDSEEFYSSIDITWDQYREIAMYVARHQQPGDKR